MPRLRTHLAGDSIRIGQVGISLQRTLRIPDDGRQYPLPPGLGTFPIRRVMDYARTVPAAWRAQGGYFLPMYQREAMWLSFHAPWWRPHAVRVGIGEVDAISGEKWGVRLRARPQNYVVVPGQPWLDGINAGAGLIRQFVAMPLGSGATVEAQVTGREDVGGVQFTVVPPLPGRFPLREPPGRSRRGAMVCESAPPGFSMGLGAGGLMRQHIYPDPHGIRTWDAARATTVRLHIANSALWTLITGEPLPPTPVDAATYARAGLPWFDLYDDHRGDVAPSPVLAQVKSVGALAGHDGADEGFAVPPDKVALLKSVLTLV